MRENPYSNTGMNPDEWVTIIFQKAVLVFPGSSAMTDPLRVAELGTLETTLLATLELQ